MEIYWSEKMERVALLELIAKMNFIKYLRNTVRFRVFLLCNLFFPLAI